MNQDLAGQGRDLAQAPSGLPAHHPAPKRSIRLTTVLEVALAVGFIAYIFSPVIEIPLRWLGRFIDAVL